MNDFRCIAPDVKLGKDVKLAQFVNLYGCEIGDDRIRMRPRIAHFVRTIRSGHRVRTD